MRHEAPGARHLAGDLDAKSAAVDFVFNILCSSTFTPKITLVGSFEAICGR